MFVIANSSSLLKKYIVLFTQRSMVIVFSNRFEWFSDSCALLFNIIASFLMYFIYFIILIGYLNIQ